jgi:hypothetical protein
MKEDKKKKERKKKKKKEKKEKRIQAGYPDNTQRKTEKRGHEKKRTCLDMCLASHGSRGAGRVCLAESRVRRIPKICKFPLLSRLGTTGSGNALALQRRALCL